MVTRENVLTGALEVFSRDGYSAARLEDIAEAAGVTRGAIYHHFGSKEELYIALVTERSAGINKLAEEVLTQEGTAVEVIRRFLLSMIGYLHENEDYRALLELATSKVEHTEALKSLMEDTIQGRRQLAAVFVALLAQGVQDGTVRPDIPVNLAAWNLISFMNGLGLVWIQDPGAFSIHEDKEVLVDAFLKGFIQ